MKRALKRIIANLSLALLSIILMLVVLEIGLRLTIGRRVDYDQVYWVYHPLLGLAHPPDLNVKIPFQEHPRGYFDLITNNQGLREDLDTRYERTPGVYRILVTGDSHTDGTVFNAETYANQLEAQLQVDGFQAEVLNGGVASYNTLQELLWYHLLGRPYQPDLLIVGVYAGNDLGELQDFDQVKVQDDDSVLIDGKLLEPKPLSLGDRFSTWLNHQMLTTIVRGAILNLRYQSAPDPRSAAHHTCRGCYWQSLNQIYKFYRGEYDWQATLERFDGVMQEFSRLTQKNNTQLVVVVIPTKRQVEGLQADAERYQKAAGQLQLPAELIAAPPTFDDQAYQEILRLCQENGIPTLGLLPDLQQAFQENGQQALYYVTDWHLNPDGQQAVGQAIARYLETQAFFQASATP